MFSGILRNIKGLESWVGLVQWFQGVALPLTFLIFFLTSSCNSGGYGVLLGHKD